MEKIKGLYKNSSEYNEESDDVRKIINKLEEETEQFFQFLEPLSVGGTSILFKVKEKRSNKIRALKFSRPLAGAHKADSLIEEEGEKLKNLNHPNIIGVYEVGSLYYSQGRRVAYFIMDYIENATDLRKRVISDIKENVQNYEEVIKNLYEYLHGVILGMEYLHNNGYLHFDIKPSNILTDDRGIPKVTDLGYAKPEKGAEETTIGFTKLYAHPDLLNYRYRQTKDENRLRAVIERKKFRYEWDIYSLGQSILELLGLIDREYPDKARHHPKFRYLHLMACRMLDGKNSRSPIFFDEFALELPEQIFTEIKYKRMSEIRTDIEKEMGIKRVDTLVPELNILSRKTLQGSETKPITFTDRLKAIIEHPLFSRLSHVSQLGLIRYVYPTVNHTRFDHSIGTFSNACSYVVALYNDPNNPLFRQLVNEGDIEAVLLASLLHDLGQYPCAHDIEEVKESIFGHVGFTKELLRNKDVVDSEGRTLEEIIGKNWKTTINRIINIIEGKKLEGIQIPSFKDLLLSAIINSPIDADKVDYILRDSRECRIPYGKVIDFDRLLKTITITLHKRTRSGILIDLPTLAVYDKGRACAESISFARYLLFLAVYWHHTSRSCKAMLQHVIRLLIHHRTKNSKELEVKLKSKFLKFVTNLRTKRPKLVSELGSQKSLLYLTDLELLDWLYQNSPEEGKFLIRNLAKRNLYKRIATIYHHEENEADWNKLIEFRTRYFSQYKYIEFCKHLQEQLLIEVRRRKKDIEERGEPLTTALEEERLSKFDELMENHPCILVDIPDPKRYVGSDTPILFVRETLEKRYLDDLSEGYINQTYKLIEKHNNERMESLRVARIFCHPDVREAIRAVLNVSDIVSITLQSVDKFRR